MIKDKGGIQVRAITEQSEQKIVRIYNEKWLSNLILEAGAQRPGLALTGYFKYLHKTQIQVFGKTEIGYLMQLEPEEREKSLKNYLPMKIPGIIVSENQEVEDTLVAVAAKYHTPILVSDLRTTLLVSRVSAFLYKHFSEKIKVNGVLVDIMGLGILIRGASGIGKSETALELIDKGHQLISDDLVEFYLNPNDEPVGRSVEKIKKWLEVRGLGVINIVDLFGVGAFQEEKKLDLVINLELWDPKKKYDRLGGEDLYFKVLDKDIPMFDLPVSSGRNVAIMIEAAVKYFIARENGSTPFVDTLKRMKQP